MDHEGIGKSSRSWEGRLRKVWLSWAYQLLSVTVNNVPPLLWEPLLNLCQRGPAHSFPWILHRPLTCYHIPCAPIHRQCLQIKALSLSHRPSPGNNFIFHWGPHTADSTMCLKLGKSHMPHTPTPCHLDHSIPADTKGCSSHKLTMLQFQTFKTLVSFYYELFKDLKTNIMKTYLITT